ncbi:MAG: DUF177 domain-containing protein [Ruminococcaceae bacterium]|nr:DUF177 domain-containing protein [Oscillospiraceae bacterium]
MILDLKPLLSGKLSKLDFSYEIGFDNEESPIIPPDDVSFTPPVIVKGYITDNAGYMTLSATAELSYNTHCARCLKDLSGKFVLNFNRTVATSGTLQNEQNDDFVIVKNGMLDIDRELVEDLLLEFPSRFLCKEECAGLCPKCFKNLNFGPCDCPKKKEIDPRLAILQKLLEND